MKRKIRGIYRKYVIFKKKNKNTIIRKTAILNENTELEGGNLISENVNIYNTYVGKATYIGANSDLNNCKIGKFCSIAENVSIIQGIHPIHFISTHPSFYSTLKQSGFTFVSKNKIKEIKTLENSNFHVEIGNDVWIGKNATIMAGVKIADGTVIAANALVTKTTEPYSVVGGVPAKVIKYRFSPNDIEFITSTQWWDLTLENLKEKAEIFDSIESFKEKFYE